MTAGAALFLMDALAVALLWPLTLRLAPPGGGVSALEAVTFAP